MPAPMDFMAHELHDPMASPSMQGNATSDVVAMSIGGSPSGLGPSKSAQAFVVALSTKIATE